MGAPGENGTLATIFVDFDGTITDLDVVDRIAQTFGDPDVYREVDEGLEARTMTLHEVLRRELEPVRAPLEEVVEWVLEHTTVRPGFDRLVRLAEERGWHLVVLSSGFRELIVPVLEREGLAGVEVVSNEVDPLPTGWRVRFRDEAVCSVCEEPCKRGAVLERANGRVRVYVGDGFSDRCAAQASDLVFARRGLAAFLAEEGVPFEPFEDFHHVVAVIERTYPA